MTAGHGTRARYQAGCRCDACTAANAAYWQRRTAERRQLLAEGCDVEHGKRSTYINWGCRCATCVQVNSEACAEYKQRTGYTRRRATR